MTQTDDRPVDTPPEPSPPTAVTHILQAIRAVMGEVRGVPKTGQMMQGYGRNQRVQYTFQRWDDMASALGAAFRTHGVVTQTTVTNVDRYRFDKTNNEGKTTMWTQTLVVATIRFTSLVDGSELSIDSAGEALDNSDKGVNKAITAAYKNACKVAFTLSTEDDADPDATRPEATGERVRNAPPQNGQQPTQAPRQQTTPPPEVIWVEVEKAAREAPEQNPEPSRLEIATRAVESAKLAKTTGDLAELAQWAFNKGALRAVVNQVPLAHRLLATRSTLPAGPPTRPQQPPQQQPAQQQADEPPWEGGYGG